MPSSFDLAIPVVLAHEGGYANNPSDPGGETKFGISHRSYPNEDIQNLTLARATEIYKRDFWSPWYEKIDNQDVATKVFDMAVNMGAHRAHMLLQKAAGVPSDGNLGPITIAAVNTKKGILPELRAQAAYFYTSLNKPEFLLGWLRRAVS